MPGAATDVPRPPTPPAAARGAVRREPNITRLSTPSPSAWRHTNGLDGAVVLVLATGGGGAPSMAAARALFR